MVHRNGNLWTRRPRGLDQIPRIRESPATLCPTLLRDIEDSYWTHICVFRNPPEHPVAPPNFEFLGYDLIGVQDTNSALANCGGFPDVFDDAELSRYGLLPNLEREVELQSLLRSRKPDEHHTNCHVWAIFRLTEERS